MGIIIRKPQSADEIRWISESFEEIGGLFIQDYEVTETSIAEARTNIGNWLDKNDYFIRIAAENDIPIGMMICRVRESPMDNRMEGYIEALYVAEDRRKHGIGSKLLAAAENWCFTKNTVRVKSFVSLNNQEMIGLSEKSGYKQEFVELTKKL